jgi:hypothetical protein
LTKNSGLSHLTQGGKSEICPESNEPLDFLGYSFLRAGISKKRGGIMAIRARSKPKRFLAFLRRIFPEAIRYFA